MKLFIILANFVAVVTGLRPGKSSVKWPCEDEELYCKKKAEQYKCYGIDYDETNESYTRGDYIEALKMLSKCRESCKRHFDEFGHLLRDIDRNFFLSMGGANDTVIDPFGYEHEVCDLSKRLNYDGRFYMLSALFIYNHHLDEENSIAAKYPPKYTKVGFQKTKVPKRLWGDIQDFYKTIKKKSKRLWKKEDPVEGLHNCGDIIISEDECQIKNGTTMELLAMTIPFGEALHKAFLPYAEEWSGTKLNPTRYYGIRRYKRNGWMSGHVDNLETHVVSAIINMAQKVDEPWALDIVDHDGKPHKVYMEPGDLVWYESVRLVDGRVTPLKGKYYDNIFLHYQPIEWRGIQKNPSTM